MKMSTLKWIRITLAGLLVLCHAAMADPSAAETRTLRSSIEKLLAEREYEAALDRLRVKAIRLEKNGANCREVFEALADAYAVTRQPAKAEEMYQKVRRGYDAGIWVYSAMGGAYRYAGKFGDAIRCYKLFENQKHPNRYLAMLNQAYCHFSMGDTAAARKIAQDMVDKKTSWHHIAAKLLEILDKADRGDTKGFMEAGTWLLEGSSSNGVRFYLPHGAVLYLQKALKLQSTSPAEKTIIQKRLQKAQVLLRPLASHSPYPPKQPYRDEAAEFPGSCTKGHNLEKQGRLKEALKAYRAFRSESTCGMGVLHDQSVNATDTARVLGKLGDVKGAVPMWKQALQHGDSLGDSRNAYQLVLTTEVVKGLRAEILKIFPDNSPQHRRILDIEALQNAVRKKNPARVFSLSNRLPANLLVHALLTIGKDSIPEAIKHLPRKNLYYDWGKYPERQNKMRAAIITIGALKDPRGVRPLCKAAGYLTVRLASQTRQALASLKGLFRKELMGWLDSDDPKEFAAAITYLFQPDTLTKTPQDKKAEKVVWLYQRTTDDDLKTMPVQADVTSMRMYGILHGAAGPFITDEGLRSIGAWIPGLAVTTGRSY